MNLAKTDAFARMEIELACGVATDFDEGRALREHICSSLGTADIAEVLPHTASRDQACKIRMFTVEPAGQGF